MPLLLGNVFLLVAVVATAGAWRHCGWNLFSADDLGRYARSKAQPIAIDAVAIEAPRASPGRPFDPLQAMPTRDGARLTVKLLALRNGATWQPVSGRATLFVMGEPPSVEAGDRVRCFVHLSAPEGPQNPGEFDHAARLRADRVLSCLSAKVPECVSVTQTGSEWNLWRQLGRVRAYGNQTLERYLDPRRAELAAAVLLGLREELDAGRSEAFLTTGTVHVLCISGLHVGILAGALFWIMRRTRLPRGWAVASVATITLLYAIMVDVSPSVVRATILVLIACSAAWLGRRPLGFNSLAAAALVVLAINPEHLFHVGAQLSFLCVAGLIWFANRRPHWDDDVAKTQTTLDHLVWQNLSWPARGWTKLKRSVVGIAEAGLLLWLLALPLVLARFHILSLAGMGLNVVLWPLMSMSLLSGFGVLLFGPLCPPLGNLCGWVCDGSFWLLEGGVKLGDRLPCGHFWLPGPADLWLWGFYGALGLAVAFPWLRPWRRCCVGLLAGWIALGFAASAWRHDHSRLDCTFLSVGHGSAVFIEFPAGKTMLYDAERMGEPALGARTISAFLWDRGLAHLDAVVLSHPDIDHYNALPELLDKFSVGAVYVPPVIFEKENRMVAALHAAIERHNVPLCKVRAGDRLQAGGDCLVEVLHPPRNGILGSENANSLVLAVEYRGRRIVLPGDLESPGLDDMLAEEPQRCEVLMAPHHGSRKSNSPALAGWCRPRWVVFSGDGRWNLPAINQTYQAVGSQTLHTHTCGAIRVQLGEDGIKVSQFARPAIIFNSQ
jgi:competence protein ComEC